MSGTNINLDGFLDIATTEGASQNHPPPSSLPDGNGGPIISSKYHKRKKMNIQREFVLKDWLASLSLGEYYDVLFKEGYDKPLSLKVLTDEELIELGLKKKGHRIILLNAIKDEYFTSFLTASTCYHGPSQQHIQPMYRLTQTTYHPQHGQTNQSMPYQQLTYQQPTYQQFTTQQLSHHQLSHQQLAPSQSQKARISPGQLVHMSFAHSDSPSSDSDMDDTPESANSLSNSYDTPAEQHTPQSPRVLYKSTSLRASQPLLQQPASHYQLPPLSRPLSPSQQSQGYRLPRYPEEYDDQDEDEDEDTLQPPPTQSSPPLPSHTVSSLKIRPNSKAEQSAHSPTPTKPAHIQSSQSTSTSATSNTTAASAASESHKAPRKRSRSAEKPEQANPDPDAPPKPKPAAITFVPKQHYSRSDIHDCLGGQRFCAISTPSAYPFILIFAHYQAYVGEDGMWEHCASGDLNKGVNRGVIHAKEKKKRLLLFFSMAGQQGAVLFLGEVKYVSSEQREEKNSKGVDKACVIFKFQRITNDAITINLLDFTKQEVMAAQPKAVIRSLTEDPNTYYLDSTYSSTPFEDANPNTSSHVISNNNNANLHNNNVTNYNHITSSNNNNINSNRRSSVSSTSFDGNSSGDIIPIASPSYSPSLSSTTTSTPSTHPQHPLLQVKREKGGGGGGKEDVDHVPTPINTPTPLTSFSNSITNLSRTGTSKATNDVTLPSITRIPPIEKGERREKGDSNGGEHGWTLNSTRVPIISVTPTSDTRATEDPDPINAAHAPYNNTSNNNSNNNNVNNSTNKNNDYYNSKHTTSNNKDDFVVPTRTSSSSSPTSIFPINNEPAMMDTN